MEVNKEQLINYIFLNWVYIEELLHEDILCAAPISKLIELAELLDDTRKRVLEILSLEDEDGEDQSALEFVRIHPLLIAESSIDIVPIQNMLFLIVILYSLNEYLK